MTDHQNMTNKTSNRQNKKNDIDRPKGRQNNKSVGPKFESFDGMPTK
ncbi:hypothetical protein [Fonticella tunisiensis]|uniref:Uncharacterized protein n=1 Tax=Fonticella tunisiensis TaxID=1096341 RepID=A0A4R7KAJ7_9CLOT|nr:hypothetical protein [Fonticella tunisiensis]TDT51892.1 hypothetical protein EDD71_11728 [Fonticella tunisiensis]